MGVCSVVGVGVGAVAVCECVVGCWLVYSCGVILHNSVLSGDETLRLGCLISQSLLLGMATLVFSALGLLLAFSPTPRSSWKRIRKVWCFTGVIFIVTTMLHLSIFSKGLESGTGEWMRGMSRGMQSYLTAGEVTGWKKGLDILQQRYECCGLTGPQHWLALPWLSLDYLHQQSPYLVTKTDGGGAVLGVSIPWSCCRIGTEKPCIHDLLQQEPRSSSSSSASDAVFYESVFMRGCHLPLVSPIARDAVSFNAAFLLLAMLHTAMLLLSQWLNRAGVIEAEGSDIKKNWLGEWKREQLLFLMKKKSRKRKTEHDGNTSQEEQHQNNTRMKKLKVWLRSCPFKVMLWLLMMALIPAAIVLPLILIVILPLFIFLVLPILKMARTRKSRR